MFRFALLREVVHRQRRERADRRQAAALAERQAGVGQIGRLADAVGQLAERVQPVRDGAVERDRRACSAPAMRRSVEADVVGADHLAPLLALALRVRGHLRRRAREWPRGRGSGSAP